MLHTNHSIVRHTAS